MKTASAIAAALAAFLIGLSFAKTETQTVTIPGETVTVEKPVEKTVYVADVAEIQKLQAEVAGLQAELQKARQRPEALPRACSATPALHRATSPAVEPEYYQPRRRLFGRFR